MAVTTLLPVKGYFDDSQTKGQLWVLAGYVGGPLHWEEFDATWPMALANHDVPYFHMREMQDPNGVYGKWYHAGEHKRELANFFEDLTKVIGRSGLVPFSSLVRLKDLERFNSETDLSLQPYSLAAYGCMLLAGQWYGNVPAELVFDHVEKVESKLARAREYADSDIYYGPDGIFDKVVITGLPKHLTFREIPALQAADFWVWEYRKNHLKLDEWWSLDDRPEDLDAQWEHMLQWVNEKHGSFEAATRRSLQELIRRSSNQTPGIIWSYRQLCEAHKARGGVWA